MASKQPTRKKSTRRKPKKKVATTKTTAPKKQPAKPPVKKKPRPPAKDSQEPLHDYEDWEKYTPKQRMLLLAFESTPIASKACRMVPISRRHYYRMIEDPGFAEACEQAKAVAYDQFEAEAIRMGVEGRDELVLHNGSPVLTEFDDQGRLNRDEHGNIVVKPLIRRSRDSAMLRFILAAKRPEYGRDKREVTGANGGPVQMQSRSVHVLSREATESLPDDVLAKVLEGESS